MIEYKTGDIFDEDVEALVNSVNCVGVMGRGIALQFRNRFPENFDAYANACKREEVQPGRLFVFETGQLTNPRYIINFPTKRHWRGKSRLADIESGLKALTHEISQRNIRSIAVPPLGSDLGGLDWREVRLRIEANLQGVDGVKIVVFTPGSAPADGRPNFSTPVPKMTPGRAALVALIDRYLAAVLDPDVTLLEVHKLMYFLQEAGEPLRLNFQQAPHGPYAENLRHVLREIEGHLVSGYKDGGDSRDKLLELVPGAINDAMAFLPNSPDTGAHLDKVFDLVEGFESSFGLELLATVHWVGKQRPEATLGEVIEATYGWGNQKRKFSERQIGVAFEVLTSKHWLNSAPVEESKAK